MRAIKTKLKKATATPIGRIIIFSILIFFIAALIGGIWYWNTHKKAFMKNKLEAAIREKSIGLYKIKYESLKIDEIAGYLSVSNMHLTYDSTRYLDLQKQGKGPSILLDIHIPKISVSDVQISRALINNEIVGRKLEIINPVINIIYTHSGIDSSRVVPSKEVYEQILGNLDLIQADTVLISNAQIITSSRRTKKTSIQFQDVSIVLMNVKVDSSSHADITRLLFAKDVSITCRKMTWPSVNKLYDYSADSLSLSSLSNRLRIKSFRLTPLLDEDAFVKALPVQDCRINLSISNIQMKNINMAQLFEQNLVADSMLIGTANLKIYCDPGLPHKKKNRVGTYPHQVIEKISIPFRVGKVILSNAFLEYKERNHITRQSGKVQFYKIYASISNFTNEKKAIAVNNVMTADISSKFLNRTPLKVTWLFYLLHPKGRFDVKGSVGPIEGALLNSFAEPMGSISIRKGRINIAAFNLQGNDDSMDGNVKILYEDLKVAMLKKDIGSKERHTKPMLNFMANIFIINSNPKKNEEPRVVQVHLDRDPDKSIFHFSWRTLLKGIKETMGIPQ
jgi:hypothetical protein